MCYSFSLIAKVISGYGKKHSLIFSNVPAFVKPVHVCGYELSRIYLIPSGMGSMATGIMLISVMDQIQCNIASDIAQIEDLDLFVSIFNRKITELAIEYEDKQKKE